jgi:hypothetical protein
MEVGDLDTGVVERTVDTSTANPTTLMQGLYAALAGGHEGAVHGLARLPPQDYHSEQAVASELLSATCATLQAAARGEGEASRVADEALQRFGAAWAPEDRTFVAQLEALHRLGAGQEPDLGAVAAGDRAAWQARGTEGEDPIALLELPVLGLRALADRS